MSAQPPILPPNNLDALHAGEEFLREKSKEAIANSSDLTLHIEVIEAAMEGVNYFARLYVTDNEDDLTIQLLLIRLFNGGASALKLAFSGYYQNSALVQRDMLETIFLLDYFTTDKALIARWRTADRKTRLSEFKPVTIREKLDERDGYTGKKRAAAYELLSELAGHATYQGFRMLQPVPGGNAHCGPFFEATSLDAVISELAKHCVQTFHAPQKFFRLRKRQDVVIRLNLIEAERKWATRFFGSTFDNSDVTRMRALLSGLPE